MANEQQEIQAIIQHHRSSGGSSISSRTGTINFTPSDYVFGLLNNDTFQTAIISQILDAFGSVFVWEGLPEGIESYDLESMLLLSGRLAFMEAGKDKYVVRYSMAKFDQNSNVIEGRIIEPKIDFLNGLELEKFRHVEIKNNRFGLSIIHKVWVYIKSLTELHRKILINARAQGKVAIKLPSGSGGSDHNLDDVNDDDDIFNYTTEDNTDYSTKFEDDLNDWLESENTFKILEDDFMGDVSIEAIPVENIIEETLRAIGFYENKILAALGMPSNNLENKNERVVAGEITIQNVFESSMINTMLEHRKKAAEKINKEFGYNISVGLNEKLKSSIENKLDETLEGGNNEKKESLQTSN